MSENQEPRPSRLDAPKVARRSFLSLAAFGSFVAAIATAVAGMLRLPKPAVLPGPVRRYKIGFPDQFPVGSETRLEAENVFLFRDERGVYAISAVCTHLGCAVSRAAKGFECPCHGSKFGDNGKVLAGPAPRALAWLEIGRAPDGQLIIYADKEVPAGTRFEV